MDEMMAVLTVALMVSQVVEMKVERMVALSVEYEVVQTVGKMVHSMEIKQLVSRTVTM